MMEIDVAKGIGLFLGAGSSCDYGFPSGYRLMRDVAKALTTPREHAIGSYLLKHSDYGERTFLDVGNNLANALQKGEFSSIDAYLENRQNHSDEIVAVCRQAMWCIILDYERRANLYPEHDWMLAWFTVLFKGARTLHEALEILYPTETRAKIGLAIYTLNYDRLFAWKLFLHLNNRYGKTDSPSLYLELITSKVLHCHGSLGQLKSDQSLPFAAPFPDGKESFLGASEKLQFWFEKSSHPWDWTFPQAYSHRETLLLVGYGYHGAINKRFAAKRQKESKLSRVYGTCFGQNENFRNEVAIELADLFKVRRDSVNLSASTHRSIDFIRGIQWGV